MPEPTLIESLPEEIKSTLAPELLTDPDVISFKNLGEVFSAAKASKIPAKPWFDNLSPELKADPNVAKYKTAEDLVKGHLESVKLIGSKGVIVPKPDAPQAEIDKFYNTLGRPEKPEGYKFTPIENLPESLKTNPQVETIIKGLFHKAGLTSQQADLIQAEYTKMTAAVVMKQQEAYIQAQKTAETELRNEWAQNYDKNIQLAKRLVLSIGGQEVLDAFGEAGNNPKVLKFLAKVGQSFAEDSIERLGVSGLQTNAAEAKNQISKINNMAVEERKNHPYWNESHRDHDKAVKEMQELYKIAYAE